MCKFYTADFQNSTAKRKENSPAKRSPLSWIQQIAQALNKSIAEDEVTCLIGNVYVAIATSDVKRASQRGVCKSLCFPSNRVAAGQVDPPAVRITMVCSLFACCLSASEAFLFLSGAVCWVFSNAYTKEEHLLVFFVASDRRRGRSYSTQKAARRLAPLRRGTCRRSKSLSL